jgi:hypothetical protein
MPSYASFIGRLPHLAGVLVAHTTKIPEISAAAEIPDELFRRAYASISDDEIRRMVRRTRRIVRLGMKRDLMKATRDITEKVKTTRSSADERQALGYIVSELDEILAIAPTFSAHDRETIVRISEQVETRYFAELRRAYDVRA